MEIAIRPVSIIGPESYIIIINITILFLEYIKLISRYSIRLVLIYNRRGNILNL